MWAVSSHLFKNEGFKLAMWVVSSHLFKNEGFKLARNPSN